MNTATSDYRALVGRPESLGRAVSDIDGLEQAQEFYRGFCDAIDQVWKDVGKSMMEETETPQSWASREIGYQLKGMSREVQRMWMNALPDSQFDYWL